MSNAYVQTTYSNNIATIEFYHPQSNSLPAAILNELAEAIKKESTNQNTRVMILQSAGEKVFCSGASFDELSAIETEEQGLVFFSGFANVINAMRKAPQFIIAKIQGKCVGGGVGLAAAADYAIACEGADIKLSELAVGIGPFVVGPAVERKIGNQAAYEMAIDASNFRTAYWAKEKGLFANVLDNIEELDNVVQSLATTLSASNPEAMFEIKKAFWSGTEHWSELLIERAAISGKLVVSNFTKSYIQKYKQK